MYTMYKYSTTQHLNSVKNDLISYNLRESYIEKQRNPQCMFNTQTELPSSHIVIDVKKDEQVMESLTRLRNSIRIKRIERSTKSSNSKCLKRKSLATILTTSLLIKF
jgi:hypothetical protein